VRMNLPSPSFFCILYFSVNLSSMIDPSSWRCFGSIRICISRPKQNWKFKIWLSHCCYCMKYSNLWAICNRKFFQEIRCLERGNLFQLMSAQYSTMNINDVFDKYQNNRNNHKIFWKWYLNFEYLQNIDS